MKKIFLLTSLLFISILVFSQKSKISAASSALSAGKLDKALDNINTAISNPSTSSNAKAYFVKGQIYQKIAESSKEVLKLMNVTKIDNAAIIAHEAYKKALQYDKKGKLKKKINAQIKTLPLAYVLLAQDKYNIKKYEKALELFELVSKLNKQYNNPRDTSMIYNTAISAEKANKLEKAVTYYKQLLNEFNYKPELMYAKLANTLKILGKRDESTSYLKEGFNKFPESNYLLYEIINYYLASKESDKALKYLDKAISMNPTNPTLYQAKATLFNDIGKFAEAEKLFKKAVEVKPDDFQSKYKLAFFKSGMAANKYNEVQNIMDNRLYKKEMKNVYNLFRECIPYFNNALILKPDDSELLSALGTLYFNLRNEDPEMMKKYEEIQEKLKK